MSEINAPVITDAVMLDKVIGEIQQALVENISWLDAAFGRSQRLTKRVNGGTIVTPNVYCGGWNGHGENDYIEVTPDSKIGNFAFFEVEDPETIDAGPWARKITASFALVVWFDLRRVYGVEDNRNTEYLKAQILALLGGKYGWALGGGRLTVSQIYERAENIYRGYTLSEIDNQFLMHPYGGFRFEGSLEFDEYCFTSWPVMPVVPDVPSGALQYGQVRFALDSQGQARIFRTRGETQKVGGEITDLRLLGWKVVGYNQVNPRNITWNSVPGGYNARTEVVKIVPGRRYVVFFNSVARMVGARDFHITCRTESGAVSDFPVSDGVAFDLPEFADQMYFGWWAEYGQYSNDVVLALDDGEPAGSHVYYSRELSLDVTRLVGKDKKGKEEFVFPYGLMAAGDGIRDEIFEDVAVRRVKKRPYIQGDESNPAYITDGVHTNYSLPKPEVFKISPPLDLGFEARRGGTVFQSPENIAALLDIVIE